ncbi:large ribosomal subunit protein eL29-like [Thomomys bottae]
MCFAKKHSKKGFKKMQANNAKAMSAWAEAVKTLVKPKVVSNKRKLPEQATHKLQPLAYTTHPKLGKRICAYITWHQARARGPAATQAQAQAAAPKSTQALVLKSAHTPASKGAQSPVKAPQ